MISGGENGGLLVSVGYIIDTLNFFYGLLDSYAKNFGSKVPGLGKIVQYLQIASFVQSLLKNGVECLNGASAVLFFMTLAALISMMMFELVLMTANPLAAFAASFVTDRFFSWLVSQSGNCK